MKKITDEYSADILGIGLISAGISDSDYFAEYLDLEKRIRVVGYKQLADIITLVRQEYILKTHWTPLDLSGVVKACISAVNDTKGSQFYLGSFKSLVKLLLSAVSVMFARQMDENGKFNSEKEAMETTLINYLTPAQHNLPMAAIVAEIVHDTINQAIKNNIKNVVKKKNEDLFKYVADIGAGEWRRLFLMISMFGPVPKKGYRIFTHMFEYIGNESKSFYLMDLCTDYMTNFTIAPQITREHGIMTIVKVLDHLKYSKDENACKSFKGATKQQEYDNFVEKILIRFCNETAGVVDGDTHKIIGNFSYGHRLFNRRMQMILLLLKYTERMTTFLIAFEFGEISMGKLNQQPSSKHLIEWIFVTLLHKVYTVSNLDQAEDSFYKLLPTWSSTRSGCVVSWLAVLLHRCMILLENKQYWQKALTCISKYVRYLLPWCTSQIFETRCFAIACLKTLYKKVTSSNKKKANKIQLGILKDIEDKFEVLKNVIEFNLEKKNAAKFIEQLMEGFFLHEFQPVRDLTLKGIFHDYSLHTNWPQEEILNIERMTKNQKTPSLIEFGLENKSNFPVNKIDSTLNELLQEYSKHKTSDFQKKIVPKMEKIEGEEMKKEENEGKIIIIASLIDKPYNLGGICRTCEILGVCTLVVDNCKVANDSNFKSLSVNSHNWIDIKEVKRHALIEYLCEVKRAGYVVVAGEQTAASVNLIQYKFPRKTALLLGNEKEGIAIDLLELVDKCVQIPQSGVTRSFNVHVSAAILLYEYAKQHTFNK